MGQAYLGAVPEALLVATIHWGSIAPFLVTSAAIMGSPGPATISLTAAGSAYGVRRSLAYLVGIIVGTTIVLVAVATGITATLLLIPALRTALIVISALYIIWLAYHIATAPPLAAHSVSKHAPSPIGGAVLGVANPKAWLAIAAVFASARLDETATTDAAAKIAVLTAMIILICTGWLIAGVSLARLLRDPACARIINTALALALVGATALAVLH